MCFFVVHLEKGSGCLFRTDSGGLKRSIQKTNPNLGELVFLICQRKFG